MARRKGGSLLVVDDDRDILDAMREVLQREGYRVLSAANGIEACTVLASESVDLILLDLLMPAMSGWEFLDTTAADPRLAALPIIVISAAPHDVGDRPNVRAVLQKPFERGALLDLIATHARRPLDARGHAS
jgi:CheY-like chemotaxis protein